MQISQGGVLVSEKKSGLISTIDSLVIEENKRRQNDAQEIIDKKGRNLGDLETRNPILQKSLIQNGFEISHSPDVKIARAEIQFEKAKRFDSCQMEVAQELHEKGFYPIAILPQEFFNAFCFKAGLYRYENINSQSTVPIADPRGYYPKGFSHRFIVMFWTWLIGLSAIISFDVFAPNDLFNSEHSLIKVASTVLTLVILGLLHIIYKESVSEYKIVIPAKKKSILKMLWPSGHDNIEKRHVIFQDNPYAKTEEKYLEPARIKIGFIEPPEEFASHSFMLEKAGYHVNVAASPDAIQISRKDIQKSISSAQSDIGIANQELKQQYLEYLESIKAEPIIYTVHEKYYRDAEKWIKMVAVHDQFGEFPDEKQVIEWVKNQGLRAFFN